VSLTEHLMTKYQLKIKELRLMPHYGGVFEVWLDGDQIWSKRQTGRFPKDEQIDEAIDKRLAGSS